jgi:hypothetical protein
MKHSKLQIKFVWAFIGALIFVSSSLTALAQNGSLAGRYEGTAKSPDGDVTLKLELTDDAGKLSGQVTSPHGVYKIVKSRMADGVLTLEAEGNGSKGKMTLKQKDDTLSGEFTADGKSGPVEFKKVAVDEITGEWDAVADAQGQPFPFSLSLKLDGEKVTGSSSSQLGTSNLAGTFKGGKLSVIIEGSVGQIVLGATMIEGKLSGDYDFAGQSSGKWVAVKKK